MTRFTLVTVVSVCLLALAQSVQAQPPPSGTYLPCGYTYPPASYSTTHQTTLFSEGTAWQNRKWAWLTIFNPTSAAQRVWARFWVDGDTTHPQGLYVTEVVAGRGRFALNVNDYLATQGFSGIVNFATIVEFSTLGSANMAVWDWNYTTVVYLLGINQCVAVPPAQFTQSGTGDFVFDLPEDVERVRIVGTYTGSSQNFIVRIGGSLKVNEIIGTSSFAEGTTYEGTHLTTGGGVVAITSSNGVQWLFTEVLP